MLTLARQEYIANSRSKSSKGCMKKVFSVTEIHQKSGGGKDLYHRSIQCPWMGRFNILKVSSSYFSHEPQKGEPAAISTPFLFFYFSSIPQFQTSAEKPIW